MVTNESSFPLATSAVREITTQKQPGFAHKFLTRILPILVLAGLAIWAGQQLMVPETRTPASATPVRIIRFDKENVGNVEESTLAGKEIAALLDLRVLLLPKGVETATTEDFGDAIKPGHVTVLNLWATWCEPCKDELPGLRSALSQAQSKAHGERVHFVPMLVDSSTSVEKARLVYDTLGGPQASAFTADVGLAGGISGRLLDLELIESELQVPITMLLDCHRRLRWIHRGGLLEANFIEFKAALAEAQAEIGTATCRRTRRKKRSKNKAVVKEPGPDFLPIVLPDEHDSADIANSSAVPSKEDPKRPRSPCLMDGVCDAEKGETTINCPSDCKTTL